ncbi:glycosyltransferase [Alicyclobacillus pomorum]|uniref:glycosyltransferase n=1 Tax=Alicyclobacillus pomorum TaxID=204470 RepID=UPI000479C25A
MQAKALERYLEEQLKSLARQTVFPQELVVCDEGSSDGMLRIPECFREVFPFPVRVIKDSERKGYSNNFLWYASFCEADLIAFVTKMTCGLTKNSRASWMDSEHNRI